MRYSDAFLFHPSGFPALDGQKGLIRSVVCKCLQFKELSRTLSFAAHKVTSVCFLEGDLLDNVSVRMSDLE